jgi:putative membrane protein
MFIYNIKINGNKFFKIFFTIITIVISLLFILGIYKIFNNANNNFKVSDKQKEDVINIDSNNYTNVLKTVHEDIDSYVGKKIKCTGYVYRLLDFTDNEFVLARDMVVSSDYQSVIVGFLCNANDGKKYQDNSWVEITGKITKGDYHGDMPIIKIEEIKEVEKPNEDFVYPPDDSFIPTSSIL